MKFEKTTRVRTPDGVEHESVEAATKHMFALQLSILGNATSADFEAAILNDPSQPDNRIELLRDAIREVFLAAWPRASKGKPRGPRKGGSVDGSGHPVEPSENTAGVQPNEETPAEPQAEPEREPEQAERPARNRRR